MTFIVDGNNVIGSRPDGWWRDRAGATRRLIGELAAWAAETGETVTVVFDGARPEELDEPETLEVVFAERGGRDAADDAIVDLVSKEGSDPFVDTPEEIRVVTSDAGLAARVRVHGAAVMGARSFRARLVS